MAYLILHIPNQPPQRAMLRGRMVIGRAFGCEVWIDDPRLSRKHCLIEPKGDGWQVVDLQSTNGTFVNSKRIDRHLLVEGDAIEIGGARIGYELGSFIEHRPIDPIEAATSGMGRIPLESDDPSDSTVIAEPTFRRPLPVPQPEIVHPQPSLMPAVPLPFTRPAAQPIPRGEPSEQPSKAMNWMQGLVSHFWAD